MVVRRGEFVAEHIGNDLVENAVQPNGVDLSIGTLYRLVGAASLRDENYSKQNREEVETENGKYNVVPSEGYVVEYEEKVRIPEDHVGLVFPRSRLMRCGLGVETAVWDAGYEGMGEGQLTVNASASIEQDVRDPPLKRWACQWTPSLTTIHGRHVIAVPVHRP